MIYNDRNIKLKYDFDIKDISNLKIHSSPDNNIKRLTINNKHSQYNENDVDSFYGYDLNNMKILSCNIISFFF